MQEQTVTIIHLGLLSLLAPVVTLVLALWTKRVIESLLAGVAIGVLAIDYHANGMFHSLLYAIPNTFSSIGGHPASDTLQGIGIVKNAGRGGLLIVVVLLGSLITILDKSGGAIDFAERFAKKIKSEIGALLAAAIVGLSIFTSAYFSIMVTGTVMQTIFDKFKISREKLSFYCDATSAPSKALLPISGWIVYMISLIEENIPGTAGNGLAACVKTMPYNFYCWLMPLFVILLSLKLIPDFGPMRIAEKRVKEEGLIHKEGSKPMISEEHEEKNKLARKDGHMIDMFAPLAASVLTLLILGTWNQFKTLLGLDIPSVNIDTLQILILSFALGLVVAFIQYTAKGLMSPKEFMDHTIEGGKAAVLGAFIIPSILPAIVFVIGAIISFATGTSWGTWAIMMPISMPLALEAGVNPFLAAAAVLSGGAFGDHCSPISDTSVLSSLAANTDHVEHVRTQLPYAIVVAVFATALFLIAGLI